MRVGSRGEGLAWPRLPSRAQPQRNADEPPAPAHDRTNGLDRGKWLRHRDLEGFPECFSGFREGLESVATTGLWREAPKGTAGHHWCVRTNHRYVASLSDCDAYDVPDRPDGFTGFSSVIAGVLRVCGHNLDTPPLPSPRAGPPASPLSGPLPTGGRSRACSYSAAGAYASAISSMARCRIRHQGASVSSIWSSAPWTHTLGGWFQRTPPAGSHWSSDSTAAQSSVWCGCVFIMPLLGPGSTLPAFLSAPGPTPRAPSYALPRPLVRAGRHRVGLAAPSPGSWRRPALRPHGRGVGVFPAESPGPTQNGRPDDGAATSTCGSVATRNPWPAVSNPTLPPSPLTKIVHSNIKFFALCVVAWN